MDWTAEHFLPLVGTVFVALFDNEVRVDLTLLAVEKRPERPYRGQSREGFELTFGNPGPFGMVQATYQLFHDELGPLSMFLTPVEHRSDGSVIHKAVYT